MQQLPTTSEVQSAAQIKRSLICWQKGGSLCTPSAGYAGYLLLLLSPTRTTTRTTNYYYYYY